MATSSLFKQSTKIVGVSTNYAAYVKDKPVPKVLPIFLFFDLLFHFSFFIFFNLVDVGLIRLTD